MIFLDTESIGLLGPTVLIQYSINEGPIVLHEVFHQPIRKTLELIHDLTADTVVAYNLSHDWFQLTKLYNLLNASENKNNKPHPAEFASISRSFGKVDYHSYTLRPKSALDLLLHCKKSEYQSLMGRDEVRIKRVPTVIAQPMAQCLKHRLPFSDIYFHKSSTGYEWKIEIDETKPQFADIVLRFRSTLSLKPLCAEIFKIPVFEFPVPKDKYPPEKPYDPHNTDWEPYAQWHIDFWHTNKTARGYAYNDIDLLCRLWHHFAEPKGGDVDSELAASVGATRYLGFGLDREKIISRYETQLNRIRHTPINYNSHVESLRFLRDHATELEKMAITDTSKDTIQKLIKWESPVSEAAKLLSSWRKASKEIDVLDKLIDANYRFYPSFNVIGAKSGRMSGGDELYEGEGSLNPQGINRDHTFRELFSLAEDSDVLSGGDFKQFEVTITDAVYNDTKLREELASGYSVHGLLGAALYSLPYEQIMSSAGTNNNMYNPAKNSFFALIYGAMEHKISKVAGISEQQAAISYANFIKSYPQIGIAREKIFDKFCSLRQPYGIGTPVEWHEPAKYVETLMGFKRYFHLENEIVKVLYDLAQNPPREFDVIGSVMRTTNRSQTIRGASQSALLATAFMIQANNMRAAANHEIQGTGAQITKRIQCAINETQPVGVGKWLVKTINVHDEILCVHKPDFTKEVRSRVNFEIDSLRSVVPLLEIDWKSHLENWAGVK